MDTPWWATGAFWAGIAISAVLSIFINFLTNLYNSTVQDFLENRKVITHEKRRSKAVKFHTLINELHSGKRDKTRYLILQCTNILIAFTTTISSFTALIVILALAPHKGPIDVSDTLLIQTLASMSVLSLLGYFCLIVAIISMVRLSRVGTAIDNFETYEKEFKARWGERQIH